MIFNTILQTQDVILFFQTHEDTQLKRNSSLSKDVLATIKLWEDARAAGAFSSAQKKALRDPQRAFKLKKQPDGSWQLTEIRQSKKTNETD